MSSKDQAFASTSTLFCDSLSSGWKLSLTRLPVVQKVDKAIHRISHHPVDKYYYPVDSATDLLNNRDLQEVG